MYDLDDENHTTNDAYNYGSADKGPVVKGYYNAKSRQQVFSTQASAQLDRTAFNVFQFEASSGAIANVKIFFRSIPNPVIGRLPYLGASKIIENLNDDPEIIFSLADSR